MPNYRSQRPVQISGGLSRREFLRVGSLSAGAMGLSLAGLPTASYARKGNGVNCILLFLVGGPSQLDTWDLKPNAPNNVRGPFRPIRTNVPGIEICEHFPRMAAMADRFAIVRSVHHNAAAIHEIGQQLMQTGRLCLQHVEHPHYGAVLSYQNKSFSASIPPYVVLPGPIGDTGARLSHGQGAGFLGEQCEPYCLPDARVFDNNQESDRMRQRYGRNTFGQSCLMARRLVERGTRLVTVNMFDTIFNTTTWDCHADGGSLNSDLDDYRNALCPMFDAAYSALLEDLHQRGLLDSTLVLAMGEFGRTPILNPRGGRDHWPGVWSLLFAGGGIRGGQIIGSSDSLGAEPRDRPVSPAEIAATVYTALGIDLRTKLPTPDGLQMPLVDAQPIGELF